ITADLTTFAENWSQNMSQNGLRHSNYSQNGYLRERGSRSNWAENIVYTSDTSLSAEEVAQLFHNTWRNSSTHYRNMINSGFTEVGIGIYRTSNGWYGTHTFSNG
ncbi:MAG: CAP domain-containing protein, partial [Planctomycetota bacterium]